MSNARIWKPVRPAGEVAGVVACHLLGLPVADNLPGRVLTQAFTTEYRQLFPIETIDRW